MSADRATRTSKEPGKHFPQLTGDRVLSLGCGDHSALHITVEALGGFRQPLAQVCSNLTHTTMRLPSLKFLKTFQVAAKHLSFKSAAEELFISPSAVSHQVKTLEEQLGIPLFDRGPHSLSLTEAGRSYLQNIEGVFSRLEAVTEQLQIRHGRALIRLHIPPLFANELLLPRLPSFLEQHPDVDIRISTFLSPNKLHPGDADISIMVRPSPQSGMISHRLFPQRFVPAAAPALLTRRPVRSSADLNRHVLIVHEARRDAWDLWAHSHGHRPLRPKKLIRFDSMHAAVEAAEQKVGIALVSSVLSAERFVKGTLIKVFEHELTTGDAYYLVHRHEDSQRAEINVLKHWLLSQFAPQRE